MWNEIFDGIGEKLLQTKAAPIASLNLSISHWSLSKEEIRLSFITTNIREQPSRSHHKGATARVRTGDQRYPIPCHCQLGQDIPRAWVRMWHRNETAGSEWNTVQSSGSRSKSTTCPRKGLLLRFKTAQRLPMAMLKSLEMMSGVILNR